MQQLLVRQNPIIMTAAVCRLCCLVIISLLFCLIEYSNLMSKTLAESLFGEKKGKSSYTLPLSIKPTPI